MDITPYGKTEVRVMKVGTTESTLFTDVVRISTGDEMLTIDRKPNGKNDQTFYPLHNLSWFRVTEV